METLIKSIIYCQIVPLDCLLMYILKIVCQASLPSFLLNLSKSDNILFRSMPNGNFLFNSTSIVIGT